YSVEYMTCTPDGSLIKESEIDGYTNSVTIGQRTYDGVIGEYSEWQHDQLHKSGYLHGVTDRFQKATWNIIDNGADLQKFDEITVKDVFDDQQEVCEEGLSISVAELDHRPSWSEESSGFEHGWVHITLHFDGVDNVAAAGDTGFETTITWDDSFEFDPEK